MNAVRRLRNGVVEIYNRASGSVEFMEKCDAVIWNGGNVMLYTAATGRYRDAGQGFLKANWERWAKHHGISFMDEFPG